MAKAEIVILVPLTLGILAALVPRTWFPGKWPTAAALVSLAVVVFVLLGLRIETWQNDCNHEGDERACELRAWWNS